MYIDDKAFSMQEMSSDAKQQPGSPSQINAFELIRMSSFLDLSGFFEKEEVQQRKIRFTSNYSSGDLLSKIEGIVKEMGFRVAKRNGGKLRVIQAHNKEKSLGSLSFLTEVFDISSSLRVVELSKSYGDSSLYRKLWTKLSNDLGVSTL
ncbi:hypothetical protein Syun_028594 [Stephania yunnanensis]|uniref:non-specific serine/threonine protein kinase n=1 Tax=Stephania yunnanensis TaxID=152371 RepID=A0AAP0E3V5_9MAGN